MKAKIALARTPLLFSLNDREIDSIAPYFQERILEDQAVLFEEGEVADFLCIIGDGCIGIARTQEDGERKVMWELHTNMVFGELSLFDGQPRSGTAIAQGKTVVYTLNLEDFQRLSREQPELALKVTVNIAKVLAGYLRDTNVQILQAQAALDQQ